jgi:hypothetical protein
MKSLPLKPRSFSQKIGGGEFSRAARLGRRRQASAVNGCGIGAMPQGGVGSMLNGWRAMVSHCWLADVSGQLRAFAGLKTLKFVIFSALERRKCWPITDLWISSALKLSATLALFEG